jgi:HTH-type transcriptional regulator, competence development regulator
MNLGETLKAARQRDGLTLKQVEEKIGHSNAYLSMLENGKIKKPSADVLYKLSVVYKIELDVLLIAAGLIKEHESIKNTIGYVLTPEEERQLLSYLRFLRSENQSSLKNQSHE